MGFIYEERSSDSPYLETVTRGRTAGNGSIVRPAEIHWHMVFTQFQGKLFPIVVGPLSTSGAVNFTEGAEILWVRFKLGTFMPGMPVRDMRDSEIVLPGAAASDSFWLRGSAWQCPDFENIETFVERLAREGTLVRDPVVQAAIKGQSQDAPPRTLRHRFLRATGLSHNHIRQFERAQRATTLLEQGVPILDTVYAAGYFDQPHLTRELKRFTGKTPAQQIASTE